MGSINLEPDPDFRAHSRTLGLVSTWTAFAVVEIYAVVSGVAFASAGKSVESGPFLSAMGLLVVLMGPFLIMSMVAVYSYAPISRKTLALASLGFMIACITVTSCINFLLLLVSSLPQLFTDVFRAFFLPCKWPAPAFVLDNFVWDWFFGLSMLLAAPIFTGDMLSRALRALMVASGTLCLIGLAWLAVSPAQAIIIGIIGWGAAGPLVFLLLAKVFTKVPRVIAP